MIPEDWDVVTATEACEFVVDCKNRTPPILFDSDYAVVRTPNVRDGKFVLEDLRFTDKDSYYEWTARAVPQFGDIMITREAPLGEVCAVPDVLKVCLGQRMMLYRPSPDRTESRYLLYSLMSQPVKSNLFMKIGGSTVGHAKVDDIRFLQLPLPSLIEQRAIAEALTDADALIESLEQLIAKKRQIKQGAMQELLTGKKRLPFFSGEWEVKRLGDVVTVRHGKSQRGIVSQEGKYPILASGGEIGRTNSCIYDRPSVLIGRKGTIDSPQYTELPFWSVDTLFFTEILSNAHAKFIFYSFNMIEWHNYNEASGVPSLNAKTIENIEIELPSFPEQIAISKVLSDMDVQINALKLKLEKARQIKQGMMYNLLTGKIRVI